MISIHKSQTQLVGSRTLLTEASDIGLAVGEWPDFIAVVDDASTGFLFGAPTRMLDGIRYSTTDGRFSLLVLND